MNAFSGMSRDEDRYGIGGGRFVEPATNRILPPIRHTKIEFDGSRRRIEGGRFVEPAANRLLPPVRTYRLESRVGIDYNNAYHFGRMAEEYHQMNRSRS